METHLQTRKESSILEVNERGVRVVIMAVVCDFSSSFTLPDRLRFRGGPKAPRDPSYFHPTATTEPSIFVVWGSYI